MIKYLVIDDEHIAHDIIKGYCDMLPNVEFKGDCYDAIEAIDYLNKQEIDLIFLDLNMPKLKGFEFLKTLSNPPKVIVTTAYSEFAIEGFELNVVDYLLKPFSFERFFQAVNKVSDRIKSKNNTSNTIEKEEITKDFILVKSEHRVYRMKLNTIDYIQSMQAYVAFYRNGERTLSLNTMKKLDATLPKNQFIRIHKSYIVAIDKIKMLEGNQVIIGKEKLPIGASYREEVMARIF